MSITQRGRGVNNHLTIVYFLLMIPLFLQNGWSPLLVAAENGHLEITKILLKNNARVDVFDEVKNKSFFSNYNIMCVLILN